MLKESKKCYCSFKADSESTSTRSYELFLKVNQDQVWLLNFNSDTYVLRNTLLNGLPKLVLVGALQGIELIQFSLVASNKVGPSDDLSGQKLLSKVPKVVKQLVSVAEEYQMRIWGTYLKAGISLSLASSLTLLMKSLCSLS